MIGRNEETPSAEQSSMRKEMNGVCKLVSLDSQGKIFDLSGNYGLCGGGDVILFIVL